MPGGPSLSDAPPGARRRSPALLATAVAVPVTVLLALLLSRAGDHPAPVPAPDPTVAAPLPAVRVDPPPALPEAAQRACRELIAALPPTLGDRPARPVDSSSAYVAAWGEPPVTLRCGVPKPAAYRPDSQVYDISGVRWFPVPRGAGTTWTVLGRAVYVEVTAPSSEASDPVARLSTAVSRALPR